jgi:hypothetical protein
VHDIETGPPPQPARPRRPTAPGPPWPGQPARRLPAAPAHGRTLDRPPDRPERPLPQTALPRRRRQRLSATRPHRRAQPASPTEPRPHPAPATFEPSSRRPEASHQAGPDRLDYPRRPDTS